MLCTHLCRQCCKIGIKDTVGGVDVNGRHIERDKHAEERTDGVSESQNDHRPPKRHVVVLCDSGEK
uniref:Aldehyde dehydrogenase n=1 Tax=Rhizophora mucronata TaxID=61149 RepID=A0A2P2MR62_RHIMU